MSKTIIKLLALGYTLLIVVSLGDLFLHHLTGIYRITFLSLLGLASLMMALVVRREEDENIKDN